MENMKEIIDVINRNTWTFAKTYASTHPHEYIVREKCSSTKDFDFLCECIKKQGHTEYFFSCPSLYLKVGKYTYWAYEKVINRRLNSIYYVDENDRIVRVENWKEILEKEMNGNA